MYPQQPGGAPGYQAPPPPKKSKTPTLAIVIVGCIAACCVGMGVIGELQNLRTAPTLGPVTPEGRRYILRSCADVANDFNSEATLLDPDSQRSVYWEREYAERWVSWTATTTGAAELQALGGWRVQFKCSRESRVMGGYLYFSGDANEQQRPALPRPGTIVNFTGPLSGWGRSWGINVIVSRFNVAQAAQPAVDGGI
jgi:hypothetical protein